MKVISFKPSHVDFQNDCIVLKFSNPKGLIIKRKFTTYQLDDRHLIDLKIIIDRNNQHIINTKEILHLKSDKNNFGLPLKDLEYTDGFQQVIGYWIDYLNKEMKKHTRKWIRKDRVAIKEVEKNKPILPSSLTHSVKTKYKQDADNVVKVLEYEQLLKKIDEALDNDDEQLFNELSKKLKDF